MILLRTRLTTADYQHHSEHLLLQALSLLYQRIHAKHTANSCCHAFLAISCALPVRADCRCRRGDGKPVAVVGKSPRARPWPPGPDLTGPRCLTSRSPVAPGC